MLKTYAVRLYVQFPSWNQRDGIDMGLFEARTKVDAIRQARCLCDQVGSATREGGRKRYTAECVGHA